MKCDVAVIGGGIVGLASARAISQRWPALRIVVMEKEPHLGAHQTGRNSGVVHSGIYYKPGSHKALLCRSGNEQMVRFSEEHGIAHERCGKMIVATGADQLTRLDTLAARAQASGIPASPLTAEQIAEREPHVVGVRGLWIPSTGIIDYGAVLRTLATVVEERGGAVLLETEVSNVLATRDGQVLQTTRGDVEARWIVNCAGLQSDRVAALAGSPIPERIVPFRGEYYELVPGRRDLVSGLVYPVPDPDFPFLGVHFTRMIDGSVHAGPNAVLALAREGYRKRDVRVRDVLDVATFPGFWHLARRHGGAGMAEVARSFSKRLFLRSLRELIPELGLDDLVPTHAGVRAQLLERSGALVDDFRIVHGERSIHVCNAPSPAATASLAIGDHIATELASLFD